jgi:gamma-glutamyltranspeptidase/glutathione hydrolase
MSKPLTRAALASLSDVEVVAEELLRKGNAVDAVVAGVFAAAALSPNVLLGPVQLLVGGGGVGLRAFDGRVRQPGLSAPRPRGFRPGEAIPDAARVGVPWLPATLSVAVATSGSSTFGQVLGPALALAKGSPRHEVLSRIGQRGPRALEEQPLCAELLSIAGRTSGGILTLEDLASPQPEVHDASIRPLRGGDRFAVQLPWAPEASTGREVGTTTVRVVAAVDRWGAFAIACWDDGVEGLLLGEFGLRAPFYADPVLRGRERVRPGEAMYAAAPMALVATAAGPLFGLTAFGATDAYDVLERAIDGAANDSAPSGGGEAKLLTLACADGVVSVVR